MAPDPALAELQQAKDRVDLIHSTYSSSFEPFCEVSYPSGSEEDLLLRRLKKQGFEIMGATTPQTAHIRTLIIEQEHRRPAASDSRLYNTKQNILDFVQDEEERNFNYAMQPPPECEKLAAQCIGSLLEDRLWLTRNDCIGVEGVAFNGPLFLYSPSPFQREEIMYLTFSDLHKGQEHLSNPIPHALLYHLHPYVTTQCPKNMKLDLSIFGVRGPEVLTQRIGTYLFTLDHYQQLTESERALHSKEMDFIRDNLSQFQQDLVVRADTLLRDAHKYAKRGRHDRQVLCVGKLDVHCWKTPFAPGEKSMLERLFPHSVIIKHPSLVYQEPQVQL